MKRKSMFKKVALSFILVLALFASSLFFSCSDGLLDSVKSEFNKSLDGKTYLVLEDAELPSDRAITYSATDYSIEKLTDIEFKGTFYDDDDESSEEKILVTASSFSLIKDKLFSIDKEGTWIFTLSAKLNGEDFIGTKSLEISEGLTNLIAFKLSPVSDSDGGLRITVKFSKNADNVVARLQNIADGTTVSAAEKSFTKEDFVTNSDFYKISYTGAESESSTITAITPGTYRLLIDFYNTSVSPTVPLNTSQNLVRIDSGIITTSVISIDLDEIYTITYKIGDGELADVGVLVGNYTQKNTITLPKMIPAESKSEKFFAGWYESDDEGKTFKGPAITKIEKGSTGDKTLYARYCTPDLYVGTNEVEDADGLTEENAVASISEAVSLIEGFAVPKDWTIHISGKVTGGQKIDSTLKVENATSLTLEGVKSTGVLDGEFNETSKGSTLTIKTSVPVTIKNLKITGGYADDGSGGGIDLYAPSSLIMESGEISGNTGSLTSDSVSAAGVMIHHGNETKSIDGSIFTMNGGTIGPNTGKGVVVYGGSNPGTFTMAGGTITGNTSYGLEMVSPTGPFGKICMKGSAVITADNEVSLGDSNINLYVSGDLTGETPVATILPKNYEEGAQVLALDDSLADSTILSSASEKIAVLPQTMEDKEVNWGLDSEGKLIELITYAKINGKNCYSVADVVNKIKSADSVTTIVLCNTLSASDIGKSGTPDTIINAIKSNSNTDATFTVSVDSTDGKIALDADCSNMFEDCSKITSLDMSGFDTSAVTNMSYMFQNCSSLTTIYAAKDADWKADDRASTDMFKGCTKLSGYSKYNVDSEYAHVGTVNNKKGYFTEKN